MQSGPELARSGARKGVLVGGNSMREGAGARGDLGLSKKQQKWVGGLESIEGAGERGGESSLGI